MDKPLSADVPLCKPFFMRPILRRLWELGIPHVRILAPRRPDAAALLRAVEHAEDLGLIAGVRGLGSDLAQAALLADLAAAGVDHLDVCCLSADESIHDALAGAGDWKKAVKSLAAARRFDVCPVAEVALVRPTLDRIEETLAGMVLHGVENVGFFALAAGRAEDAAGVALHAEELPQAARFVEDAAEHYGLRLLWYPPVRYEPRLPPGEQVCRGPRTGGDLAVRVEPDGAVILARGPYRAAGNLLVDPWETIRQSEVFRDYARLVEIDEHCGECPGLVGRPVDCPRNPARWAEPE